MATHTAERHSFFSTCATCKRAFATVVVESMTFLTRADQEMDTDAICGQCAARLRAVVTVSRDVLEWPRQKYLVRLNHALAALDAAAAGTSRPT